MNGQSEMDGFPCFDVPEMTTAQRTALARIEPGAITGETASRTYLEEGDRPGSRLRSIAPHHLLRYRCPVIRHEGILHVILPDGGLERLDYDMQ